MFLKKTQDMTGITGHGLEVVGRVELLVQPVGLVMFHVVQAMSHESLVGFDQLRRHGYTLTDTPVCKFVWGRAEYPLDSTPTDWSEAGNVEEGPVHRVVREHHDLFSEEGVLRQSTLPGIQIETEPGVVIHSRTYSRTSTKGT